MKVIDLLNKIANGEEIPKEMCIQGDLFLKRDGKTYYDILKFLCDFAIKLNDEVEIIEEKKIPEKLDWNKNDFTYPEGNLMSEETADMLMEIQDKVNFILDYLKSKGDE